MSMHAMPIWTTCSALVWALLAVTPSAQADNLRCGGALIQTGDPAAVVRSDCGPPDFIDQWVGGPAQGYGAVPSVEEWTYNRGPSRLLQILVFENGKLKRFRDDGYGFIESRSDTSCRPADIARGMSKYRLLESCGEPVQKTGRFFYSTRGRIGTQSYTLQRGVMPIFRERWIFNFGGNRFLREVTLENAMVVEIDTLDRGYDR